MIIDHARPKVRVRVLGATLTCLTLLAAASMPLFAQRFQYTFGGANPTGEMGNAVIQAANGDIITAGTSVSASGTPQVYVVRTDANGNVGAGWQYLYDVNTARIGGATDIKEYPNGDLIVVGWSGPVGGRQAFAMRLDALGNILWVRILATTRPNTQANSVVVMQTIPGAGDIVIGGVTGTGAGTLDGMMARLDNLGNVLWERTYALPPLAQRDEVIYSVDEARSLSPGDIVAVGESRDVSAGTPGDIWVLRVDGNGTLPPPGVFPYGAALYGGPNDNDLGLSIQELRNGTSPGDLIIAGSSTGRPAPSTSTEMVVMQLSPEPCAPINPRAARWVGDNGTAVDGGMSVREITSPAVGNVGDIVVGGVTGHGVWGNLDGCMQKFQEGTLNRIGGYYVYGGLGDDEIRSIAEVTNAPNTQGFAFAGITDSPDLMPPGNIRNLWLGKNDGGLNNTCHYEFVQVTDAPTGWVPTCVTPTIVTQVDNRPFPGLRYLVPWTGFQVCYWPTKLIAPEGGSATIAGTSAAVTGMESYPNPVTRGSSVKLTYTLTSPGIAGLTITDLAGRTLYHNSGERPEGETTELIDMTGWANGTYIATATVNGTSATTRIVVAW